MCNLPASTVSNLSSWTRRRTTGRIGLPKCFVHRCQAWTRAAGWGMVESLGAKQAERHGESCWGYGFTSSESAKLVDTVPCEKIGQDTDRGGRRCQWSEE